MFAMRPINKGEPPEKEYKKYQDAQGDLIERLGAFCSYCEMPIQNAPEVEHKESKSKNGELLKWENFLLSCKYCNTRKGDKVAAGEKNKYLWPDEDNTLEVFDYTDGRVKLNKEYLLRQPKEFQKRAERLLALTGLDNIPCVKSDRDRRFLERVAAWGKANYYRKMWDGYCESDVPLLDCILDIAYGSGFYSTWIQVFHDVPLVCNALGEKFPGTRMVHNNAD